MEPRGIACLLSLLVRFVLHVYLINLLSSLISRLSVASPFFLSPLFLFPITVSFPLTVLPLAVSLAPA